MTTSLLSTFFLATLFSCTYPAHPAACTFTSGKGDALLSQLLYFFSFIATGGSAQELQQTPISITKPEGEAVLINCHVSSPDFTNVFTHWCQKRVSEAPKRVAYMSSRFSLENQSDEGKFTVKKDPSKSVCTLTVSNVSGKTLPPTTALGGMHSSRKPDGTCTKTCSAFQIRT